MTRPSQSKTKKDAKSRSVLLRIFAWMMQVAIFPLVLMAYGWYLGQLHQSMVDLAGIIMFMTGVLGFVIGSVIFLVLRKVSWQNRWYMRILMGIAGCIIVFIGIVIYARMYK